MDPRDIIHGGTRYVCVFVRLQPRIGERTVNLMLWGGVLSSAAVSGGSGSLPVTPVQTAQGNSNYALSEHAERRRGKRKRHETLIETLPTSKSLCTQFQQDPSALRDKNMEKHVTRSAARPHQSPPDNFHCGRGSDVNTRP